MTQKTHDFSALSALEQGTLKTTGAAFKIVTLDLSHVFAAKALHDEIIDGLGEAERAFMLRKGTDYFAAHLAQDNGGGMIGVVSEDRLIAQATIVHPTPGRPDTGMVDMRPVGPPESVSVLQAVSVVPGARGNGLMNKMVDHWLDHAAAHKRTYALGEIDTRNVASWSAFLHGGLYLDSIGEDPSDGTLVYNAYEAVAKARGKRMMTAFNRYAGMAGISCPLDDVGQQKILMEQGYAGVDWFRKDKCLILKPVK